jgi:hypothetical protein
MSKVYTIQQEWNAEDKLVWSVSIWPFDTMMEASNFADKLLKDNAKLLPLGATVFFGEEPSRGHFAGIWRRFKTASEAGKWVDDQITPQVKRKLTKEDYFEGQPDTRLE